MSSSISVVIATHNRADSLADTLAHVGRSSGVQSADEVVVVANACTDRTEALVDELAPDFALPLRLVQEPTPGLGLARNSGASAARGEILAYIDDDVRVSPGWLSAVRESFDAWRADLGSGPVSLDWSEVPRPDWLTTRAATLLTTIVLGRDIHETSRANHFVGANLAVRRSVWAHLGGFVDGLGRTEKDLLSGEDSEFVARALNTGARGIYHPDASLLHVVAPNRATPAYLAAAAEGRGRTRVALSRRGDEHRPARLARYGLAQVVRGSLWALRGRLTRDMSRQVDGRIVRMRGLGTLRALAKRAR